MRNHPHADFLPAFATSNTPALINNGRCDYLSWSSAQEYLRSLPDAKLLYLDGSGHNAYQDEPKCYMAVVRSCEIEPFRTRAPVHLTITKGHAEPVSLHGDIWRVLGGSSFELYRYIGASQRNDELNGLTFLKQLPIFIGTRENSET